MRVEPEFVDHPKLLKLKRRVGADATDLVLRLWGHCQGSQRGGAWRNADAEYVEVVCRWQGEPNALFNALCEVGFVDPVDGGLIIHDWDQFNSKARASWANGKTGGRPHKEPNGNPPLNPSSDAEEPNGNPPEKPKNPTTQGVGESVGESGSQSEGGSKGVKGERGTPPPSPADAGIPSFEEVRAWALASKANVDPDFAEEKRAAHSERDGWKVRGKLIDWRERFARFWTEEKEAWLQKRKKNAARRGAASERPDGWKEGDQAWWWSDALTSVQAALGGASQLDDKKTAARLREIIGIRKGAK